MKMKAAGNRWMILGTIFLLTALIWQGFHWYEAERAAQKAQQLLPGIEEKISERCAVSSQGQPANLCEEDACQMPEIEVDGYSYIGYLTIPVLNLKLPIMSEWDETRLKIAPCRQFGTTKRDDLVIAGHNYKKHFGKLSNLSISDLLQFTDADGIVSFYRVGEIREIPADALEDVKYSKWDLVLYTCTYSGTSRIMVGAARITEQEAQERMQ